MALPNNAKIKDIITELQDMQMINGKSEVANIIGSPVTQNDTPAQIVTKVLATKTKMANNLTSKGVAASSSESVDALATKIGSVTPATMGAKRFKSGVATSSNDNITLTVADGRSVASRYIRVTGLGFKPSCVIIRNVVAPAGTTVLYPTLLPVGNGTTRIIVCSYSTSSGAATQRPYRLAGGAEVNADGFTLPVYDTNPNTQQEWYAYE